MWILLSILIVLLGLVGAESLVTEKVPASRNFIAKLREYKDVLGFSALVLGIISLIEWISLLQMFSFAPGHVLLALMTTLISCCLGLLFGLEFIRRNLPQGNFVIRLELLRVRLLPQERALSLVAIVVGVICFITSL